MEFLYPGFLWALGAVAIPIVIHLFHFRRFKKVFFTNVRFLREVKEETSARRRLRDLLVLAMRILAVAALVIAFAQPVIPLGQELLKGQKAISIFVDNSFSMSALSQDVPLVEVVRRKAREIVEAYAVDDQFQILTHDFEGHHQRLVSKEEALSLIDQIGLTPSVHSLDQVLLRQTQVLRKARTPNRIGWVLSDFQQSILPEQIESPDTSVRLYMVPLQAVQEQNIAIDSAWFESPVQMLDQTNLLFVKVHNYGNETAENVRLGLQYEGEQKPVGMLSIPARASVIDTIPLTVRHTGWHEAALTITDFPVQFDDAYFITFYVDEQIDVMLVSEEQPNPYLVAALKGLPYFQVVQKSVGSLDYSSFPNYELIVLQELPQISSGLAFALIQYVKQGGNVLVFVSKQAHVQSYNDFLRQVRGGRLQAWEQGNWTCSFINTDEYVFRDVFENEDVPLELPTTTGRFRIQQGAVEEALLRYRDGLPYLVKYPFENGRLYLCTSPLNEQYNDLVRQAEVFIPLLYKAAIASSEYQRLSWTIGKEEYVELPHALERANDVVWKIKRKDLEFIPDQQMRGKHLVLSVRDYLKEAGVYRLVDEQDQLVAKLAFNYDRTESNLRLATVEAIQQRVAPWAQVITAWDRADFRVLIGTRAQGMHLWKWFVWLALAALGIEIALLRLWKV